MNHTPHHRAAVDPVPYVRSHVGMSLAGELAQPTAEFRPSNHWPLLWCTPCAGPTTHRFVGKTDGPAATFLVFECACGQRRICGCY